jgi:hypothetical protein
MRDIIVTMSGEELAKGPLADELIAAVQKTLAVNGYRDVEHRWEGPSHRLVYHRE